MKRNAFCLGMSLFLSLTLGGVWAQTSPAPAELSLSEALKEALEKNYRIEVSRKSASLPENDYKYRNSALLPQVNLTGSRTWTVNNLRQEFFNPNLAPVDREGVRSNNIQGSVQATWTVFDGLGMFVAIDRLKELRNLGRENLRVEMDNTLARVADTWTRLSTLEARIARLKKSLEVSQARLELAKNRYEVGAGSRLEYLNAQVDINTDLSLLKQTEQQRDNAQWELAYLLGRTEAVRIPVDTLPAVLRLEDKGAVSREDLRNKILQKNPQVLAAQQRVNLQYLEERAARADRYPTVNLVGSYNLNNQNTEAGLTKLTATNGFVYGVNASVPLLNGFNQNRLEQNARINRAVQESEVKDLKASLVRLLDQALVQYQSAEELLTLERSSLAIARQNQSIAYDRYKLGVASPLEFREAQRNVLQAENRLIDALQQASLATVEIYRLTGQWLPE